MMKLFLWILLLLPSALFGKNWQMQTPSSHLGFVTHWEQEPIEAYFEQFLAKIRFDPADLATSRFAILVTMASVNADNAELSQGMAEDIWFDSSQFPLADFSADRFTDLEDGNFIAHGKLRLKARRRALDVPFRWVENAGQAQLIGQVQLDRRQFGVGSGAWADDSRIGFKVQVVFDLQLIETVHEK